MSEEFNVSKHEGKQKDSLEVGDEIYQKYKDKPFYGIVFVARNHDENGFVFGEMIKTPDHVMLIRMATALIDTLEQAVSDLIGREFKEFLKSYEN